MDEDENAIPPEDISQWGYKGLAKRHRFPVDKNLPFDRMFCATSMIVELGTEGLFELLCQLVSHLVQAFEACACRLGLLIYQTHFARLYYVGDGIFYYEVRDSKLWGKTVSLEEINTCFADRNDYCAHSLGSPYLDFQPGSESLDVLKRTMCAAVARLACLPFHGVTYDHLKKHAAPEWLSSVEEPRFGSRVDEQNSEVGTVATGQVDVAVTDDALGQQSEVGTVGDDRSHNAVQPVPDGLEEVWWDSDEDVHHTPVRLIPVYCALEKMGVHFRCVSPMKMSELVARYGDPTVLNKA